MLAFGRKAFTTRNKLYLKGYWTENNFRNTKMDPNTFKLSDFQTKPGSSAKDSLKHVGEANVSDPEPPEQIESEIQAGLRSCIEQKRRLQIRICCQRLHDLLPFVNGRLDTASTLELTAKYMSYLSKTLSKDMLSKVDKSIEENRKGTWNKKPPKTRKTYRLRRRLSLPLSPKKAKPVAKKHSDDIVAAHPQEAYMYRHIQPRNSEVCQSNITVIHPLRDMETNQFGILTGIPARPVLLDESTVPRGQMLPVCQNLCTGPFVSMNNNYKMSPLEFLHPTAGMVTSIMESQTFKPEMKQSPATLSSVVPGMLQSTYNHVPMTPDQSWFVNWTSPDLLSENQTLHAGLNETCPQAGGVDLHHVPPPIFEDGTQSILNSAASPWSELSANDVYCDSPPSLSSSCLTLNSNPVTYSPQSFAACIWFDPTKFIDTPVKSDVAPNIVFSP